jgi:hypothetical protein
MGTKSIAVGTEISTILMQQQPQDDTDHQRWWEVNGASHFSLDQIEDYADPLIERDGTFRDAGGSAMSLSEVTHANGPCTPDMIYSPVPSGDIMKAGQASLNTWISGGPVRATAPRFVVDDQTPPQYVRDGDGQVLGASARRRRIPRSPRMRASARVRGSAALSGNHVDFTRPALRTLRQPRRL